MQAVRDLHARGRTTTAAGVKSEMRRLSAQGFDESRLGYPRFRDFLQEAQRLGAVVVVAPSSPGRDAIVALPGDALPPTVKRKLVRPDLWRAFIDWTPGMLRVYDRSTDRAVCVSTEPAPLEPTYNTEIRDQVKRNSAGFIQITPVSPDEQMEWAKSFVETLASGSDSAAEQLASALDQPKPLGAFTALIKLDSQLAGDWARWRETRLVREIRAWSELNGLRLEPYVSTTTASRGADVVKHHHSAFNTSSSYLTSANDLEVDLAPIRDKILAALSRMPTADLLRLSIPAEYLLLS